MDHSKVRLSAAEMTLACNAEVILTKNRIIEKVLLLLGQLGNRVAEVPLSHPFSTVAPKVSRGENYGGLPYAVLDYPRLSGAKGVCFIRSFFWWGQLFSSTLQVSGSYRAAVAARAEERFGELAEDYSIGVSADPWEHHFGPGNYRLLKGMEKAEFSRLVVAGEHLKLARSWPLARWEEAPELLEESWKKLAGLIT
jgi:hypothetical protein